MSGGGLVVAESLGLVRDGLVGLLAGWPHGPVRGAATVEAAAASLLDDPGAMLLLDLELLGDAAGQAAGLQALRHRFPGLRIVAMAGRETRDGILQCLAAGAHGYIAKTAGAAELARAMEVVWHGGVHVPAALAASAPVAAGAPPAVPSGMQPGTQPGAPSGAPWGAVESLTGRQRDVLRLLAEGRSTKDIARTLDLAVSTIKVHLAAVYRTFGAHNRVEALCRAGCLPPSPGPARKFQVLA